MAKGYYKGSGPSGTTGHIPNTVHNTGGSSGSSMPQQPIAGPENPGQPISMRKALVKKDNTGKGVGLPNKSTSGAGSVR